MRRVLLGLVFVMVSNVLTLAQSTLPIGSLPNAPSRWVNQRGSELTVLTQDGRGGFTGFFINRAAGFQCQNRSYPVTGKAVGRGFFFAVTFSECNSVTVWRSVLSADVIQSNWTLSYVDQNGVIRGSAGTDAFKRVP